MSWFSGSFANALFGAARKIFDTVLAPASRARAEWEQKYVEAEAAVANLLWQLETQAQVSYRSLTIAEVTSLHGQSKRAADLAYAALKLAQTALDAMGESIVETVQRGARRDASSGDDGSARSVSTRTAGYRPSG